MLTDWPLSQGGLTLPKGEIKMIERIQKMQTQQYKKKAELYLPKQKTWFASDKIKKTSPSYKKGSVQYFSTLSCSAARGLNIL